MIHTRSRPRIHDTHQHGCCSPPLHGPDHTRPELRSTPHLRLQEHFAAEKKALLSCYREAFRQGGAGAAADAKGVLLHWGFELGGVEGRVRLWNGGADVNVAVGGARWMKERLGDAELTVFERESHFGVPVRYAEAILGALMGVR